MYIEKVERILGKNEVSASFLFKAMNAIEKMFNVLSDEATTDKVYMAVKGDKTKLERELKHLKLNAEVSQMKKEDTKKFSTWRGMLNKFDDISQYLLVTITTPYQIASNKSEDTMVWDNGGETIDRYFIAIKGYDGWDCYSMSAKPNSTQGVNMYSQTLKSLNPKTSWGKKIPLNKLPQEVMKAIEERQKDYQE